MLTLMKCTSLVQVLLPQIHTQIDIHTVAIQMLNNCLINALCAPTELAFLAKQASLFHIFAVS